MNSTLPTSPLTCGPIKYRNHFRWRIMPPDKAAAEGLYDRSFENKKEALAYQEKVKAEFPNEPCCLIGTGRDITR